MTSIYQAIAKIAEEGKAGVICTIMHTHGSVPRGEGSKMLVYADGSAVGTVGGGEVESRVIQEALSALNEGKNRVVSYKMVNPREGDPGICGGQLEVFIEPINPKPVLVVVGGGHVGQAVTHLAHWMGYRVVVTDDRPEMSSSEYHPEADEFITAPLDELTERLEITPYTYLVLTTRGIDIDVKGLPALLRSPAPYIGVIGSKRRWITTRKKLLAETDVTEDEVNRIHSPIGLDIEAETPEEIAVSIMAEIMMLRSGGTGQHMKM
jgi:xanthine dehydrogenase accessory factor